MNNTDQSLLREEVYRIRERIVKEKKGKSLLKKCEEIEQFFTHNELSQDQIVKYRYKLINLEWLVNEFESTRIYKARKAWVFLISLYAGLTIALSYMISLKSLPGMFTPVSLITFMVIGVIGTMTKYLLGEYKLRKTVADQFLLAFLFPVIFVNVFTYNDNEIQGVAFINLLMFVCGFSVEFLLLFLNRILDIAKKTFNLEGESTPTKTNLQSKNTEENKH